jgi:hypothetical protein
MLATRSDVTLCSSVYRCNFPHEYKTCLRMCVVLCLLKQEHKKEADSNKERVNGMMRS